MTKNELKSHGYKSLLFSGLFLIISFCFGSIPLQAQIIECPRGILIDCDDNFYRPDVRLDLVQDSYSIGDTIDVLMVAEDFKYISSMQFTLTFNPNLMELVEIPERALTPVLLNAAKAETGNIALIWFNGAATGVCLEKGAVMFQFQFVVKAIKGVDNYISVTNNMAEKEYGITIQLGHPSCPASFEVEDMLLETSCSEFCTDINICQADFVTGEAELNIEICGGEAPYVVSLEGEEDQTIAENEIASFDIEEIFSQTDLTVVIQDAAGLLHDTTIVFEPIIGVDVNTTIFNPSCNNISNGRILIDGITSDISNDFDDFQFEWSGGIYNTPELTNLSNGTYFLTITDPFGCEHVKSFDLFTERAALTNLVTETECEEAGRISFQYEIPNELDELNQILVRDQNLINYPNETMLPDRYFNNDLPPGIYTISLFTENGCSIDTTLFLLGDVSRIGGTMWVDENRDGVMDEEAVLEGIPIGIYNCGELDDDPLGIILTDENGEFSAFVNEGSYQIGIADGVFSNEGELALFSLEQEVVSAEEGIDNDNNLFFESDITGIRAITDCVEVACPHDITGDSQDMSIDLAVLLDECQPFEENPSSFDSDCEAIKADLENRAICDLNEINGFCGVLDAPKIVTDLTPYCVGNETADNIVWFAFYAPESELIIEVNPIGCLPGRNADLGIHSGIYRDCGLVDQVWCSDIPCAPRVLSTPLNIFEAGELYYMYIDGCAGAVCNYILSISCLSGDCSLPVIENFVQFDEEVVCGFESIQPSVVTDDGETIEWPNPILIEENLGDEDILLSFQDTIVRRCGELDILSIDVTSLANIEVGTPFIECEENLSSIVFSWEAVSNADSYSVQVLNGPLAGIFDAINLTYTVNDLLQGEVVEIEVTATSDLDCSESSATIMSCITGTSSVFESDELSFKLYPNPASEVIQLEGAKLDAKSVFTISDINGVQHIQSQGNTRINVSELPAGVYFMSTEIDGQRITLKFLKF